MVDIGLKKIRCFKYYEGADEEIIEEPLIDEVDEQQIEEPVIGEDAQEIVEEGA